MEDIFTKTCYEITDKNEKSGDVLRNHHLNKVNE